MTLNERDNDVLGYIVRDFVRTAVPVSSDRVLKKYHPGVSSATIRNIMLDLEGDGYLDKPHTSAGRVPTDKGYRCFVDNLTSPLQTDLRRNVGPDGVGEIVRDLAHDLHIFVGAVTDDGLSQAGFSDVLAEPEFREHDMLCGFGEMIDSLEDVIEEYKEALNGEDSKGYNIWIGEENPIKNNRLGSAIVACVKPRELDEITIFAFGPKRMDYERVIKKLSGIINHEV